jgi:hypothetical protein
MGDRRHRPDATVTRLPNSPQEIRQNWNTPPATILRQLINHRPPRQKLLLPPPTGSGGTLTPATEKSKLCADKLVDKEFLPHS